MSYIGTPPSNAFTSLLKQDFSTSATTGYTLDHAVNNANDIALFINFVRQEPTAGYAASGTTLTLTSATASSDDMYCVYLGQALQTVNPPNVSVGTAQLIDGAVTSAKLASGAVANTPAFFATLGSVQSVSNYTWTKASIDTEIFDTDSCFASNKFTPNVAGKYFFFGQIFADPQTASDFNYGQAAIYKNGSFVRYSTIDNRNNPGREATVPHSCLMDMNGSSDYVELYGQVYAADGAGMRFNNNNTFFGGYKIIT